MTVVSGSDAMGLLSQLNGRKAERARVGHGSTLMVDFGPERTYSSGSIRGEWHLLVFGAAWRLETDNKVLITSEAERGDLETVATFLDGKAVRGCNIAEPSYSLEVSLTHGVTLRTFNLWTEPRAENWMIYMPEGMVLSAEGGSLLLVPGDSTS